jgi:hypothetical protein
MTSQPCSDPAAVVVLEGMPGTGKTTAAHALHREGRLVVGEYLDQDGGPLPASRHPAVGDDDAHQRNWTAKHHHITAQITVAPGRSVCVDRDWVSALAYAYSLPATLGAGLLSERARWAAEALDIGGLAVAGTYLVFHLDPVTSLQRRAGRLAPNHPWSRLAGLTRLARFYRDPATALEPIHPELAHRLHQATWRHLAGLSVDQTLRLLRGQLDRPHTHPPHRDRR